MSPSDEDVDAGDEGEEEEEGEEEGEEEDELLYSPDKPVDNSATVALRRRLFESYRPGMMMVVTLIPSGNAGTGLRSDLGADASLRCRIAFDTTLASLFDELNVNNFKPRGKIYFYSADIVPGGKQLIGELGDLEQVPLLAACCARHAPPPPTRRATPLPSTRRIAPPLPVRPTPAPS